VGRHPLTEVRVGGVEVKVIEGVVAIVQRGSGEGRAEGEDRTCEEKQEKTSGERDAPGDSGQGRSGCCCRRWNMHSFLLPHGPETSSFDLVVLRKEFFRREGCQACFHD